jgi:alginate O-acetyltransferase complex protein AlgI
MNFISLIYGVFLLLVVGIYWSLGRSRPDSLKAKLSQLIPFRSLFERIPTQTLRLWVLLLGSLVFYASLQLWYVPLILLLTFVNFILGKTIAKNAAQGGLKSKDPRLSNPDWEKTNSVWNKRATFTLTIGIIINVLLLVGFKYIPFLLTDLTAPLNFPVGDSADWLKANLIAPLGLSFFTFECIAYLIDIYRGAPATKNFLKFSSYKLFFPKLISGPITRYHYFAAQLRGTPFLSFAAISEGLWLIAVGAVKKALIADSLGIYVDLCFGNLERAGSGDLWLAILAYGLQLYFDFSGYVDIARGSAMLLGINLPQNFNFPYFTTSIAQFWRRWHMTLGDWLRNYLYFPLGGSRQGLWRTCLNLLIVMLVAGIWHGAAWGFVVWGACHGVFLAVHRLVDFGSGRVQIFKSWWGSIPGVVSAWLITQLSVFTAWIFFRLPRLDQSWLVIQRLFNHQGDIQFTQKVYVEALSIERIHLTVILAILVFGMGIAYTVQSGLKLQLNWLIKLVLVPLCLFGVWLLAPEGGLPYIYFDF